MDSWDIALRLVIATVIGAAIGLDRDLHGKPTGMRTLGVVSLGSALMVLIGSNITAGEPEWDAVSRIIQGIVTGIGFLGAGVIMRTNGDRVQGFTTAASIWLTAGLGVACGLAAWRVVAVAVPLVLLLLVFGKPVERRLHAMLGGKPDDPQELS